MRPPGKERARGKTDVKSVSIGTNALQIVPSYNQWIKHFTPSQIKGREIIIQIACRGRLTRPTCQRSAAAGRRGGAGHVGWRWTLGNNRAEDESQAQLVWRQAIISQLGMNRTSLEAGCCRQGLGGGRGKNNTREREREREREGWIEKRRKSDKKKSANIRAAITQVGVGRCAVGSEGDIFNSSLSLSTRRMRWAPSERVTRVP